MKNEPSHGHSTRNGSQSSPYVKYGKMPMQYKGEVRLANGDLKVKANDKPSNKYQ